jgi:hypothetical protein
LPVTKVPFSSRANCKTIEPEDSCHRGESYMKRSVTRGVSTCCAFLCLCFLAAAPAKAIDKKEVVTQARAAYYNLRAHGVTDFKCSATPNWAKMLDAFRQQDQARYEQALSTLNQLNFVVSVGASGKTEVTHNHPTASNAQQAGGLQDVYKGMEQMMSGFFDTWSPFAFNGLFPEPASDYQLDDLGSKFRLTYKDGAADVETTMGRDFAISELKVTSPSFRSSIRPRFSKGAGGFVLTGYTADYEGQSKDETTHLEVWIDYQQVSGLTLPRTLSLKGSYGASAFQVELTFSGCQASKP